MKSGDLLIAKYLLGVRLGVGGMGEVWSAKHVGTGREFALKVMHPHIAASETSRVRFVREARVSSQIQSPGVVDVIDVGSLEDGRLYMVMERLEGMELAEALTATPPLSVRDLCVVLRDVAAALGAAHAVGIVHRDIKPANIFLHTDRTTGLVCPKILDFGVSKFASSEDSMQTQASSVVGSPRYMSPEQTRSAASTDAKSDVWALGVVLFEGLTASFPHEGDGLSGLVLAIASEPPRSIDMLVPHVPEAVRSIVRDCLLPWDKRLGTAAEVEARLTLALCDPTLNHIPLPPRPPRQRGRSASVSGLRFRSHDGASLSTSGERTFAMPLRPSNPEVGYVAPPVVGASTMSVATLALPSASTSASFPGIPGAGAPPVVPDKSGTVLRVLAAVLALVAVGIGVAIFLEVRAGAPQAASPVAPSETAAAAAPPAASPAAAPPAASPAAAPPPTASQATLPSAASAEVPPPSPSSTPAPTPPARATAAAPKPKPAAPPAAAKGPKSKVEELGSGL